MDTVKSGVNGYSYKQTYNTNAKTWQKNYNVIYFVFIFSETINKNVHELAKRKSCKNLDGKMAFIDSFGRTCIKSVNSL